MGNFLSKPNKKKKTLTGENLKVKFGSSEMQGWRVSMEDAKMINLQLDDATMIFGVFDGHGGHEVSEYVARHFIYALLGSSAYEAGDLPRALTDVFFLMDEHIGSVQGSKELTRISKRLPDNYPVEFRGIKQNVGCTAVVALIRGKEIYVANAGDSRCVLNRAGGAIDLSIDHKPSLIKEKMRIEAAGGVIANNRVNSGLNMTRSIGDLAYKKNSALPPSQQMITCDPEISQIDIEPSDKFLVLACDGIWEVMSSQQCIEFIQERLHTKTLGAIAEEVLEFCVAPKISYITGCDNMTIIIVAFKHPFL